MNPKNISPEDLTLFAMQLLSAEENAEIITHLEHNEQAREELARIQGDLAMYAMVSELHSPPALARERLLKRVAKEKKLVPVERSAASTAGAATGTAEEPVLRGRGRLAEMEPERASHGGAFAFLTWAGWAVAAGLAVAAGFEFHQRQLLQDSVAQQSTKLQQMSTEAAKAQAVMDALTNSGAMQAGLHGLAATPADQPKPEGHAAYMAQNGSLVFVASHLAPLQPYKTYELWVIPADGRDAVPAGLFKPDAQGSASVIMPDIPKGVPAKTFGVTIEDDGGAKTPSPPIVMAGL